MHRALRFSGALDIAALRRAVEGLVNRHEALRTVFQLRDREIVQIVRGNVEVELKIESPDDGIARAQIEVRKPFNLSTGPLVRFLLLEEAGDQHLFLMVVHHIVADEWSLDICLDEINKTFNGEPITNLTPLQFGDYALQKRADITRNSATHVDYWRRQLDDIDHTLRLPFDHPRSSARTFEGGFSRIELNGELARRLSTLARQLEVTPFVLAYTAFTILLARLTGQTHFAVGTPRGKPRRQRHGICGGLVRREPANALPHRTRHDDTRMRRRHARQVCRCNDAHGLFVRRSADGRRHQAWAPW